MPKYSISRSIWKLEFPIKQIIYDSANWQPRKGSDRLRVHNSPKFIYSKAEIFQSRHGFIIILSNVPFLFFIYCSLFHFPFWTEAKAAHFLYLKHKKKINKRENNDIAQTKKISIDRTTEKWNKKRQKNKRIISANNNRNNHSSQQRPIDVKRCTNKQTKNASIGDGTNECRKRTVSGKERWEQCHFLRH